MFVGQMETMNVLLLLLWIYQYVTVILSSALPDTIIIGKYFFLNIIL